MPLVQRHGLTITVCCVVCVEDIGEETERGVERGEVFFFVGRYGG